MSGPKWPESGELWCHDYTRREIRIDRVGAGFVYATGVQSGRSTRIRLRTDGCLPSPWFFVRGGSR